MALSELIIDEVVGQEIQNIIDALDYQVLYNYLVHQHVPDALMNAIYIQIREHCLAQEHKLVRELILSTCQLQQQEDEQEAKADALARQHDYIQLVDCNAERLTLLNRVHGSESDQQVQLISLNQLLDSEFPKREALREQRQRERQMRYEAQQYNAPEVDKLSPLNYERFTAELKKINEQTLEKTIQLCQKAMEIGHSIYVTILEQALSEKTLKSSVEEQHALTLMLSTIKTCRELELQKQQLMALLMLRTDRMHRLREHAHLERDLVTERHILKKQCTTVDRKQFNSLIVACVSGTTLVIPALIGSIIASLSLVLIIPAAISLLVLAGAMISAFAIYERQLRSLIGLLHENKDSIRLNERALLASEGQEGAHVPNLTYQIQQEEHLIAGLQGQVNEKQDVLNTHYSQQPVGCYGTLFYSQQMQMPSAPVQDDIEPHDNTKNSHHHF